MIKELEIIIQDLKQCLEDKKNEISESEKPETSVTTSLLQNRLKDIVTLENQANSVTNDPFQKNNIIAEFTTGTAGIKLQIAEIINE